MEAMLAEQPLLVSLMLGALAVGLFYGWLQTGKKEAAIAGLVFALLIPVAWIVASRWETDREQIESLIYEIADAVERNDHEAAVKAIGDPQTKAQARQELQNWTFELAQVNRISSIDVIQGTSPLQAEVNMSVKVNVTGRGVRSRRVPRRLLLKFENRNGDWFVTDYRHMPIAGGPDQFSTPPSPR